MRGGENFYIYTYCPIFSVNDSNLKHQVDGNLIINVPLYVVQYQIFTLKKSENKFKNFNFELC